MTLLELAGFFKANHFNIVNQDEVGLPSQLIFKKYYLLFINFYFLLQIRAFMEVCTFSAEERLSMLSEIAGSVNLKYISSINFSRTHNICLFSDLAEKSIQSDQCCY